MFSINRDPGHNYLMETRSRFVDVGALYGSRYFFERIGYDRSSEVKVLGDAFYEERLVMRAILQATCEKYLGEGIKSDQEEMKYLLDNAVEASRDLNLSVGVALTKEQIEALREPIIWYVERQVCGVTALAPVIYIPENILAALPSGGAPKLAGDRVDIKTAREVLNNGLLHGGASLSISAGSIGNISVKGDDEAEIGGGTVFLLSQGDILNSAAIIRSEKSLTAMAGNDFASMGGGVGSAGDAVLSAGGDINFGTAKTKTVKHESRYGTGGVSSTTISRGSTLTVAGDLTMSSGRDINFVGSSADVTGNADLKTAGSFNLMNDYDTESYSGTRARHGNFSNSRTTVTSYDKTVVSSSFSTGGNLSVDSGNDVNILGSSINTGGDYSIRAEGTQKIIAAHDEHYFQKETKKSGFGSGGSIYGSEKRGDMTKDTIVGGSALEIRGKYASQSGKDTNITGSGIIAGDTVDITTGGSLNITADYDTHDEEHGITKGRTMSGATFYSKELDLAGSGYNETAGSQITAGGKLTVKIAGDLSVEGSEIRADSAVIDVRGNFTETGARSIRYDYHVHEKTKVTQNMKELAVLSLTGGCSIYKDLRLSKKGKLTLGGGVTCENGRMSVNVAKVEYKKSETRTDSASQTSSSLKFTNCYEINTGKDFTLAASEIKSDVDGSVTAGGDVYIIATEETSSTTSKVTRGTADLSAGVKHASSDVYYAAREVAEATKALAEAKKDYDNFRDNLRKAEDDRQRGLISDEEYRVLESERKYFEANIAILTENVVAKTAHLVSAGKGAAGSIASGALGFSADGRLDLSGSITTSGSSSITHVGSRLTACGNLTIKSADRAMIEGSDVSAAGDLTLEAKNIEITASMDSTESGSRTTGGQISFNWSSSGSGSDSLNIFGANLSASGSEDRYSAASYNNAHLKGGNISIKSADDITVRGALSLLQRGSL